MNLMKYSYIIVFLLIIEIYEIICKPYSSWETSSSWSSHTSSDGTVSLTTNEHSSSQVDGKKVSEVNKSNTTVTKPDGSVIQTDSDNSQSQPESKPKSNPKPVTQTKKTTTTTYKPKTSEKPVSPPTYIPEPPIPPVVPDPPVIPDPPVVNPDPPSDNLPVDNTPVVEPTSTTGLTTEDTEPIIDEVITNPCYKQCLEIFTKCRYFGTLSSLNDINLDIIYPPPLDSYGDCLCKSEQNHIAYYYECAKCLQTESNNPNSSITDQNIKSTCQSFPTRKNKDYSSKVIKMDEVSEKKEEPKKTGINKRNLIIICSVLGVGLVSFGGYKITKYVKDKRRESLPMY